MSGADDEIVVALTAQTEQFNEKMEQAGVSTSSMAAQASAAINQLNTSITAQGEALLRLDAAFQGSIASAKGMQEAELALDQAMATGAITAEQQAVYLEQLNAVEGVAAVSARATATAVAEQTAALRINGGVAREVGVMIGELARGNYTRLEGSTITLANRTGFLTTALNAILSPLGLVAVAAAAVGYSIFEAGQEFEKMEGTVLATGDASGYTAGQLVSMADRIGESTGSIGNASEAVQKLAESGRFAGQDLRLVAQAAADMSALTGESVQSAVAQIEKLQEDPLKAVAKLNDQFHFLTVAEYEQMEQLAKSGDTMGAARVAYEAMASSMESRTDTLNQHVNVLVANFRKLKVAWAEDMQELDVALGGGDDSERLAIQVRELNILKEKTAEAEKMHSSVLPEMTARLQQQTLVVQQMTAQFHAQTQAAANVGAAAQKSAEQIDQMAKKQRSGGSENAAQADKEQYEEMQVSRNLSLGEERAYWELIAQTAQQGTAEYRQALQQLIEIHNKEGEAAKQAARKSEEAARQRNAATMNELQVEREETRAASAERIQIDAQVTDRALQLYGRESSEYRRALAERLSDTKAYVSAVQADQKRQADEEAAIYQKQNEAAIKAISSVYTERQKDAQQELQLRQITSEQEIALLRQYADQEYQTELGVLEHYRALMAERPRVVQEINKQIEELEAQHKARMDQINQKETKDAVDTWNRRLEPITRGFNQSISGMIMGTQTLKQGMDRMFQSILLSEIQTGAQRLQNWAATEMAKTGATVAGNAVRTASDAAAARTGMAENAAMSEKQIYNAAYTAAANTYASVSQIPYVGWIMAPIAAAGAFIAVEAFDNVSSAAGGWDRVPYDDAPALLHRNEMVLPAHIANPLRDMVSSGGSGGQQGGGEIHIHLNTMDGKSTSDWLRRGGGTEIAKHFSNVSKNSALTRM